jgi:hypothetical protein
MARAFYPESVVLHPIWSMLHHSALQHTESLHEILEEADKRAIHRRWFLQLDPVSGPIDKHSAAQI